MAKVTGPLMSFSASGKLGNAIVYFVWKGRDVVRQWLIPRNPESADQGDIRLVIGGLGRAVGKLTAAGAYAVKLVGSEAIPDDQTRQSYLVKFLKDTYIADKGATMTGNYAAELAELTGHTAYTGWQAGAVAAAIADFDIVYASIDPFEGALGLYLLAKAAIAHNFTGAPYTVGISTWTGAQIDQLVNHLS